MTGMLLKDWYCLWDMLKRTVLLLGVLYPFLAIATNMPYLALMMPFLLAYYSLSSIAMDDKCQWFRYARTLPVPVQAQVGAKYLIVVISSGIHILVRILVIDVGERVRRAHSRLLLAQLFCQLIVVGIGGQVLELSGNFLLFCFLTSAAHLTPCDYCAVRFINNREYH